jgi:hypothetical protein
MPVFTGHPSQVQTFSLYISRNQNAQGRSIDLERGIGFSASGRRGSVPPRKKSYLRVSNFISNNKKISQDISTAALFKSKKHQK